MSVHHPLPFQLKIPGEDTLDSRGARSVSYRLEGLLHLESETLRFEWAATRHTEMVSIFGVKDYVDESPVGSIHVPRRLITRALVRGGWWAPRVQFWAQRIDAFDGIPGARPGTITLRVRRRDRVLAHAVVEAIASASMPPSPANG